MHPSARLAAAAIALAAAVNAAPAHAAFPGGNGLIAYSDSVEGNRDIYSARHDDVAVRNRLTQDPAPDTQPAWSPDGGRIAFTSRRDGNDEVYVMNADGSGVQRLTDHPARDGDPAWSPDGTTIVFASERTGDSEIFTLALADPATPRRITDHPARDSQPAWAPDGSAIAFVSDRAAPRTAWVMDPDGSNPRRAVAADASRPDWNPSSGLLAYSSIRNGPTDIYVSSPVEQAETQMTSGPDYDFEPAWSPDGLHIVFARNGDLWLIGDVRAPGNPGVVVDGADINDPDWQRVPGSSGPAPPLPVPSSAVDATNGLIAYNHDNEIWAMNADGTGKRRLAAERGIDRDPAWSPYLRVGGQRIAFVSSRDGAPDLYTMDADGGRVRRITRGGVLPRNPTWSPDGERIAFEGFAGDRIVGIYVVSARGGRPRRISPPRVPDRQPAWAPEGEVIAFNRLHVGICVMRPDGSRQLCPQRFQEPERLGGAQPVESMWPLVAASEPAWSRDGATLFFTGFEHDGPFGAEGGIDLAIQTLRLDGTRGEPVRDGARDPEPSPDGRALLWNVGTHLWKIEPMPVNAGEGGESTNVAIGTAPAWQPVPTGWSFGAEPLVGLEPGPRRTSNGEGVRVRIRNDNDFPVDGTVEIRERRGPGAAGAARRARRTRFRVAAGRQKTVTAKLARSQRRLRDAVVVLRLRDPARRARIVTRAVRVRRR